MQNRLESFTVLDVLYGTEQSKLACLDLAILDQLSNVFQLYHHGHIGKSAYGVSWKGAREKANIRKLKAQIRILIDESDADILQGKAFWDNQNIQSNVLFSTIKKRIEEEGVHFTQSTDFLRYQHEQMLSFIKEWAAFAKIELAAKKKKLSQHFYISFHLYLQNLIKTVQEEEKRIESLSLNRFLVLLDEGVSTFDDDHLFHIREKLEISDIHVVPELSKIKKGDGMLIRQGYHPKTFNYFYTCWQPQQLSQLYEKLLPKSVHQALQLTNIWRKLPSFFSPARKKRSVFFSHHVYQLAQIHVQSRSVKQAVSQLTITEWDNLELNKAMEALFAVEKKLEQLIKVAEKETPKGFWSRLFRQKTKAIFQDYKSDLQNKLAKIRKTKQQLQQKVLNWSERQSPLTFQEAMRCDFNRIAQIRAFLREVNDQKANDYIEKTDMLTQLMQEVVNPHQLYLPEEEILSSELTFTTRRVNKNSLEKVIALAEMSTTDKNQKRALLVLQDLILGKETILIKSITLIRSELLPLITGIPEEQEIFFRQIMKAIIYRYLYSQIGTAQSTVFQFIQCYDEYASSQFANEWQNQTSAFATESYLALKELFSHFPVHSYPKDIAEKIILIRVASSKKVNYYQEIINIVSNIIKQYDMRLDAAFDNIINQLGHNELIAQYGSKLFYLLLEKKDYATLRQYPFFTLHANHALLSFSIREQLLIALNQGYSEELNQLCWQFCGEDEMVLDKINSARFRHIKVLQENTADESAIIEFISNIKNSPYCFPATENNKEVLMILLGSFDAGWGRQQKLLYENFAALKDKQAFYTSWLKGLILGKHNDTTLLTKFDEDDVIQLFGSENLKNYFYPLIVEHLNKDLPSITLEVLNTIFTEKLTIKLAITPLTQQFFLATAYAKGKKQAENAWNEVKKEYEQNDPLFIKTTNFLIQRITEAKEIYRLHIKARDSEQYIYADTFLKLATSYLNEAMLQAVLKPAFGTAFHLNRVITQLLTSNEKAQSQFVYNHRYDIILTNMSFISALSIDATNLLKKKDLQQHILFINEKILEFVRYSRYVENSTYSEQIGILKNMSAELPADHPMKACFLYVATYLEAGKASLHSEAFAYITYHDDFKLILDCIFAIANDKMLPIKPEALKESVIKIMKSPYVSECYKIFWQEALKSCEEKARSRYLISLVYHLGSYKHRQFFAQEKNLRIEIKPEYHYVPYETLPGQEFIEELNQTKRDLERSEEACAHLFDFHYSFGKFMQETTDTIFERAENMEVIDIDNAVNQFKKQFKFNRPSPIKE